MTIFEALVVKAGVPDKAGNVFTKKALREVYEQLQKTPPKGVVGARLEEKPDGDELYVRMTAN